MVPLTMKRHRLYHYEIPHIISGLLLNLEKLTMQRENVEEAKITYRTLYRLMFVEKGGRPKYPEFTWEAAEVFLKMYKNEN